MLLAAAAAVIDDEGKYKGRSYERREIRLYGRHGKNRQSINMEIINNVNLTFERYNEKKIIYIWFK